MPSPNIVPHVNGFFRTYRWIGLVVGVGVTVTMMCVLVPPGKIPVLAALFVSLFLGSGSAMLSMGIANAIMQRVRAVQNTVGALRKHDVNIWPPRNKD